MAMLIQSFVLNPFGSNCYVIASEDTKTALIIDPNGIDMSPVFSFIEEQKLIVAAILLTHGHIDHVLGNDVTRAYYKKPIYLHEADWEWLERAPQSANEYFGEFITCAPPDHLLEDGQILQFDDLEIRVLHTPGHSLGSVCFLINGNLISGDTLFAGSVGRTDLPGGSMDQLVNSIRTQLWCLPDETRVYPGHMEDTTIGDEKNFNPFVGGAR
jgi:hydroxyacylglutathione hydrolase